MKPGLATYIAFILCTSAFAQTPAGPTIKVDTVGAWQPAVTVDPETGRYLVVWQSWAAPNGALQGRRFDRDGTLLGEDFRIDRGPGSPMLPTAATNKDGAVFVAWRDYDSYQIHGRAYDREGGPRGPEFRVDTDGSATYPSVASLANGGFAVVWLQWGGGRNAVLGRRFDSGGRPLGREFEVGRDASNIWFSTVAGGRDDSFLVVWSTLSDGHLWARRYGSDGQPGQPHIVMSGGPAPITMNSAAAIDDGYVVVWTAGDDDNARFVDLTGTPQSFVIRWGSSGYFDMPIVGADETGAFTVARTAELGSGVQRMSVRGMRFAASGLPREAEFLIAQSGLWATIWPRLSAAVDPVGNLWVSWQDEGGGGSSRGTFVQRYGGLLPAGAVVDTVAGPRSDGNGVLEPGEAVDLHTSWRNVNGAAQTFSGTLSNPKGPAGALYAITDGVGDYGTVPNGHVRACSDCFGVRVSLPATRPLLHWDVTVDESIAPDAQGQHKRWRLHVGDSFSDVPRSSPYYRSVETLLHKGVSGGCGGGSFCPQSATSREQMAALLLLSKEGSTYTAAPCRVRSVPLYADVPPSSPFCPFIEELARRGITGGCGGGNFCPGAPVSREQMSVFVLRTLDPTLDPPACGTPVFADVPASSPYCRWIEELARRGIATGCGGGNFCPTAAVTREQMAVFLTGTFGLRLY